jgi:hypothetical protein
VAIQSPDADTTAVSTTAGMRGFSSLRDTLLDGDTSNSETRVDVEGEYICNDEGCDEGNMSVEVRG